MTHLRYFGYCFNPVSFYYCFDSSDSFVEAILAEVTNTPWKERHAYVIDLKANKSKNANLIGKNRDTIKFTIHGDEMNFEVIGFRMIENYEKIISGKSIDIAYTIEKNIWKNICLNQTLIHMVE